MRLFECDKHQTATDKTTKKNDKKAWSFRGDRIQWNCLVQTAASGFEVFPTFRDLTPSSGCAGGFLTPKLITGCPTGRFWHLVTSFCAAKPPAHPEDEDGIRSRNVGKPSVPDAAVCPRKFHWTTKSLQIICILAYDLPGGETTDDCWLLCVKRVLLQLLVRLRTEEV